MKSFLELKFPTYSGHHRNLQETHCDPKGRVRCRGVGMGKGQGPGQGEATAEGRVNISRGGKYLLGVLAQELPARARGWLPDLTLW